MEGGSIMVEGMILSISIVVFIVLVTYIIFKIFGDDYDG